MFRRMFSKKNKTMKIMIICKMTQMPVGGKVEYYK